MLVQVGKRFIKVSEYNKTNDVPGKGIYFTYVQKR